ncbi:hypothetical protein SD70_10010 [Gordoniibacillus kamchatkensis]|uniref:Uncharacterized protein n=1 Tax=Gordoniibacillus kamchatkensis TaxID=1590651 RepID=A0ABR5AJE3_9BACL|nr:hypothetical protein SD70_10010 [Paenibacillus sp. VKM B-2647]
MNSDENSYGSTFGALTSDLSILAQHQCPQRLCLENMGFIAAYSNVRHLKYNFAATARIYCKEPEAKKCFKSRIKREPQPQLPFQFIQLVLSVKTTAAVLFSYRTR